MKQFEISLAQIVQAEDFRTKKVQGEACRKMQARNKTLNYTVFSHVI